MDKVTIIIPVKDEESGLEYLVEDFSDSKIEQEFHINFIFVIDERTSDNSREIAKKLSNRIIDQKGSHGKGDAMRQALSHWEHGESDFVVFLHADGSYSFHAVRDLIIALRAGSDIVSGSRFLKQRRKPEGMSGLHNFGNRALSLVSSVRNGRKISDLCTGIWGFRAEAISQFSIHSKGFDLEAELAGRARKLKLNHTEISVDWSQRKGGTSKLRSIRDGLIIFFRILLT